MIAGGRGPQLHAGGRHADDQRRGRRGAAATSRSPTARCTSSMRRWSRRQSRPTPWPRPPPKQPDRRRRRPPSGTASRPTAPSQPTAPGRRRRESAAPPPRRGRRRVAPVASSSRSPPVPTGPTTLVFTLTPSQEAGGLIDTAEPLAERCRSVSASRSRPSCPTDYAGVIVALESGQAQIAGGLGPVQMVQAEDEAGADLILQSERFGSFEYVTQWFTNDPDTYCDGRRRSPTKTGSCSATASSTPTSRPTARSVRSTSPTSPARRSPSSTRARRRATSCRRCSCSTPASTRSTDITPLFAGGHDARRAGGVRR